MRSFLKPTIKKSTIIHFTIIVLLVVISSCPLVPVMDVHASCTTNVDCSVAYMSSRDSPAIVISRDVFSSGSQVNILIHAPDFNSDPYAIDTIGEDGSQVIISTRENSIHYRLVETGFDTGDFEGYVVLSSTTSICTPICGPTNGFLAASGDDAITVSLVYTDGSIVSSTSFDSSSLNHRVIPEFQFTNIILLASMMSLIFFSVMRK